MPASEKIWASLLKSVLRGSSCGRISPWSRGWGTVGGGADGADRARRRRIAGDPGPAKAPPVGVADRPVMVARRRLVGPGLVHPSQLRDAKSVRLVVMLDLGEQGDLDGSRQLVPQ